MGPDDEGKFLIEFLIFSWSKEKGRDVSGAGKLGGVGKHSCVRRLG